MVKRSAAAVALAGLGGHGPRVQARVNVEPHFRRYKHIATSAGTF